MNGRVLITGGAGFIGSHIADELLNAGYEVRVLDSLVPQVHGPERKRPDYLSDEVELIVGDVRDPAALGKALERVDAVLHFAALVGVGQSMYQIVDYIDTNNRGTAVLLEALVANPVERLVVASSMSIYGEGMYCGPDGSLCDGVERSLAQLKSGAWEVHDAAGNRLTPVPTSEVKPPVLASVYALSKYDQERMCLLTGRAYNIPTVALRLFNVYGPRQALSNPYTGVLAIFSSRYLNRCAPLIFEDGRQKRDFVNVRDVAAAARLAIETPKAVGQVLNIGSGRHYTVREIAERVGKVLGAGHIEPIITGKYRVGDIRHCFADISMAREVLHYEARVPLEEGLAELALSLEGQIAIDHVPRASSELAMRGLTV